MVRKRSISGFTFIELVIFIVVSSIALVGVLAMYLQAVARSSDAIVSKQALESGYSLLEEIQAMPFTFCDVSNPNAATAINVAGCSPGTVQGLAPTGGKSRGSLTAPFNNVGDYGGYTQTGITDINGNAVPSLSLYKIAVALSQPAIGAIAVSDIIRIDVTITGPSGPQAITGYRLRHSPNALP